MGMECFATLFLYGPIPSVENTKRSTFFVRRLILSIPTQYTLNKELRYLLEVEGA
jgi:hypothetical protein